MEAQVNQRILYLPIHAPGSYHDRSVANKRGLYNALAAHGEVHEFDYLSVPRETLYAHTRELVDSFHPTLIFLQIGADNFTPEQIRSIRQDYGVPVVNWNGDYWPEILTGPTMLAVLREIDLQLVVNAAVLPTYSREGIRAAFWPFGIEEPRGDIPDMPGYDVVYLGNNYSAKRQQLYEVLRSLPCKVGVYGSGWAQAEGECNHDFATGYALYSRSTLTISDNQFPDSVGYLSDRPFQAMAAGCCVLQQTVPDLETWTGFVEGAHYVKFDTLDELPALVDYWLRRDEFRNLIAHQGQAFVREHHTFARRVTELFEMLEMAHAH